MEYRTKASYDNWDDEWLVVPSSGDVHGGAGLEQG